MPVGLTGPRFLVVVFERCRWSVARGSSTPCSFFHAAVTGRLPQLFVSKGFRGRCLLQRSKLFSTVMDYQIVIDVLLRLYLDFTLPSRGACRSISLFVLEKLV
jgi:hypothetical protein